MRVFNKNEQKKAFDMNNQTLNLVAGAGFEPATFGL